MHSCCTAALINVKKLKLIRLKINQIVSKLQAIPRVNIPYSVIQRSKRAHNIKLI